MYVAQVQVPHIVSLHRISVLDVIAVVALVSRHLTIFVKTNPSTALMSDIPKFDDRDVAVRCAQLLHDLRTLTSVYLGCCPRVCVV